MSLVTHVVRRGAVYYFRARVPTHLRVAVGRKELWRSLRTADAALPAGEASSCPGLTEALWRELGAPMTPDEIKLLVNGWLTARLQADEDVRLTGDPELKSAHAQEFQDNIAGAFARDAFNESDVAAKHVDEIAAQGGFDLSPKERAIATQMMMKAHKDLTKALFWRDDRKWRPYRDGDPAQALVDN